MLRNRTAPKPLSWVVEHVEENGIHAQRSRIHHTFLPPNGIHDDRGSFGFSRQKIGCQGFVVHHLVTSAIRANKASTFVWSRQTKLAIQASRMAYQRQIKRKGLSR
jgi:hypothetical protein